MRHVKEDLAALERFANSHAIGRDYGGSQILTSNGQDADEFDTDKVIANVTLLANQQTQTAISVNAIFIPHGKNVPQVPGQKYIVATSNMECRLCQRLIKNGFDFGNNFDLASRIIIPEFRQMADAMTKVLQSCPEFTNGWCYQDLGGSQKLRGPCPDHLICHYCLGLNPLMCV